MSQSPTVRPSTSRSTKRCQPQKEKGKCVPIRKDCQRLESVVHRLFISIPKLPSDELSPVLKLAKRLGGYAFLIRGACTKMFLAANDVKPLPGGRGRVDAEGKGRRAQLRQLAAEAGVSRKTLETDARIYETFFKDRVDSKTGDARILTLSREMFVVALAAPDPGAAVQVALEHAGEPGYGRRQLRQHVRELLERAGVTIPPTRKPVSPPWTLPPEAEQALAELQELSSLEPSAVIAEALLRYRKILKRSRRPENSDQASGAARLNADATAGNTTAASSRRRSSTHPEFRTPSLEQPTLFPTAY